eukprot:TRINITY_DN6218_c0_g4_i1.p1 TRINITY_DN6218_c0_g4~~TRINITY_DN6218_c0_g4_i1.p1  ORF type:complete len:639 (-),score=255.80 TRINITY_DN6218_c0_g4_i1:214-2130(-)
MWQAQGLLNWSKNRTIGYSDVDIQNFSTSWQDGMAFCALLHSYHADAVPFDSLKPTYKKLNLEIAFNEAEYVGISRLMDPEDIYLSKQPDEKSIALYLSEWYKVLVGKDDDDDDKLTFPSDATEEEKAQLQKEYDERKAKEAEFIKTKADERPQRFEKYKLELDSRKGSQACSCCGDPLADNVVEFEGRKYHPQCFICTNCHKKISPQEAAELEDEPGALCDGCFRRASIRAKAERDSAKKPPSRLAAVGASAKRDPNSPSVGKQWEEQGTGGESTVEDKARYEELKRIEEARKNRGANPFAELERQKEEEMRKKMEKFKQLQASSAASSSSAATSEPVSIPNSSLQTISSVDSPVLPGPAVPKWKQLEEEKRAAAAAAAASAAANPSVSPRAVSPKAVSPRGEVVKETGRQSREEELKRMEEERRATAAQLAADTETEQQRLAEESRRRRERELKEMEEQRKARAGGGNPFREMERQKEEEMRKKMERLKLLQLSDTSSASAASSSSSNESTSPLPSPASTGEDERKARELREARKAEEERKAKEQREAEMVRQEDARKKREEELKRMEEARKNRAAEEAEKAAAVQAAELARQQRDQELKQFEEARKGRSASNPFKEMERQREEERRKKYEKFLNK